MPFLTLLSALAPDALAFCGYYAASAGSNIYNNKSVVVLARDGEHTTLTLANDFSGDVADFALLVPVPRVLTADDVQEIDPDPLIAIDAYSAPRLVSYPCPAYSVPVSEQALYFTPMLPLHALACAEGGAYESRAMTDSGSGEAVPESSVTIEASFLSGVYEITILSAEQSNDLLTWLNENGYAVSESASATIQEYISAGAYFLVAKVSAQGSGGVLWLPPLQLSYESEVMSLPIKMGAQSSAGEQDLIVFTLTDENEGQVGIANYPEARLTDDCLMGESYEFGSFYDAQFSNAIRAAGDAAWVREYSWKAEKCDPCTTEPLSNAIIRDLGGVAAYGTTVTRLHMRYTPSMITQDAIFYMQGYQQNEQARYVQYAGHLTSQYPVCDIGYVQDDSECAYPYDTGGNYGHGWLCAAAGFAPAAGGIALATMLTLRRRSAHRA